MRCAATPKKLSAMRGFARASRRRTQICSRLSRYSGRRARLTNPNDYHNHRGGCPWLGCGHCWFNWSPGCTGRQPTFAPLARVSTGVHLRRVDATDVSLRLAVFDGTNRPVAQCRLSTFRVLAMEPHCGHCAAAHVWPKIRPFRRNAGGCRFGV